MDVRRRGGLGRCERQRSRHGRQSKKCAEHFSSPFVVATTCSDRSPFCRRRLCESSCVETSVGPLDARAVSSTTIWNHGFEVVETAVRSTRFAALVLAIAALCPSSARTQPLPDRVVGRWIEVALDEIAAHRVDPPHASRLLATLSVAMERAAVRSQPDASADAAVDGAASTVLAYFFHEDTGRFHGLAERAEHAAAASSAGRGFALGRRAGEELVARAENDGADAPFTGTIPVGPEYWVPTPPGFLPPLLPRWGEVRPWNIANPVLFRPAAPPRPGEPAFETELQEVYRVSQTLTPEQRAIALFWADGPGTFTPPGHWN